MKLKRTSNTLRNSLWGAVNKLITLFFPFVTRTCIIYILGNQYAGLNSLFTSILSVLSLAELGFGNAIVYSMYKPISDNDSRVISALMNMYKRVYHIIGIIVLVVGLVMLPAIPYLIKGTVPGNVNVYALYSIYLFNSVVSYWLYAYKNCLLTAFQRNDITNNVSSIVNLVMYVFQIIFLLMFRNYYLFVAVIPISSIVINVVTANIVDRKFPHLKAAGWPSKQVVHTIKTQVSGLFLQRLAFSTRNALDSIVISAFIGLQMVGIYNNYFYILTAVTGFMSLLFTSMQGGLGNSIAVESKKKNYSDFRKINFLYVWIAAFASIMIFVLVQPFMVLWVGKDLLFPVSIVALLAVYFYAMKMTDSIGAYIAATGLWWKCRFVYIGETVANLVLNIILGYYFGVIGVIIATIITVIIVDFEFSNIILHRYFFNEFDWKVVSNDDIIFFVVALLSGALTYLTCSFIPMENERNFIGILTLAIRFVISAILPNICFWIIYHRTSLYHETINWFLPKITNRS